MLNYTKIKNDIISVIKFVENLEDEPKLGIMGMSNLNETLNWLILAKGWMDHVYINQEGKDDIELIDDYNQLNYLMKIMRIIEFLNDIIICSDESIVKVKEYLINAKIWLYEEFKMQQE